MKILAFAASNSRNSINKKLVTYATTLLDQHEVDMLDINDYAMPIYSIDLEETDGIPTQAAQFLQKIAEADALVISYAEHNGNYTAAYKNLFDWATRKDREVYKGKPVVMLSTSPGPGGAQSVLSMARDSAHFFSGRVVASLSVPSFNDNYDTATGELSNAELIAQLKAALAAIDAP